jgi:hypothetical protein
LKPATQARGESAPEELYHLYKRRKISKAELIRIIGEVGGFTKFHPDATAREVISDFLALASASDVDELWAKLSPSTGGDPFLKGILRRS